MTLKRHNLAASAQDVLKIVGIQGAGASSPGVW